MWSGGGWNDSRGGTIGGMGNDSHGGTIGIKMTKGDVIITSDHGAGSSGILMSVRKL